MGVKIARLLLGEFDDVWCKVNYCKVSVGFLRVQIRYALRRSIIYLLSSWGIFFVVLSMCNAI